MKRFIIMVVVATLLLGLAISELILVRNFIDDIEMDVNNLVISFEENQDDITPLVDDIELIEQKWDSKQKVLCLMFNHKDISTITDCLTRVSEYSKQNNYGDAIVDLKILQEYVRKNHDIMGCNINNIF